MTDATDFLEIKPGDSVVVDRGGALCWTGAVTGVTRTLIVIGHAHFSRETGEAVPAHRGGRICLGDEAARLLRERDCHEFLNMRRKLTPAGIRMMRDACDAAEAALRHEGKWEEAA